jgi:predicted Rossmann fold nucleotide-binding protein DprA/Smf involved in DNA uptake
MSDKEKARERMALLKRLREEHAETVEQTQVLLKQQQAFRKKLRTAMRSGPKTVPQIADETGLPSEEVLWHLMAMKKYDIVREVGRDGEYYQYQLAEEATR